MNLALTVIDLKKSYTENTRAGISKSNREAIFPLNKWFTTDELNINYTNRYTIKISTSHLSIFIIYVGMPLEKYIIF